MVIQDLKTVNFHRKCEYIEIQAQNRNTERGCEMRIALLCNDDITTNIIFSKLFSSKLFSVVAVYFARSPLPITSSSLLAAFYLFRRVAFSYWVYLVFTNAIQKIFNISAALLALKAEHGLLSSVKKLASDAAIPVKTVDSFSSTAFENEIKALQPDLLIVRIGEILPKKIFDLPSLGTWCVHSSLLPSARGIAGEFHVLRRTDLPMGSSVFKITEKLDGGPILSHSAIQKQPKNSLFSHVLENNNGAGIMLNNLLQELYEDKQPKANGGYGNLKPSYYGWPKQNDLREFRSKGYTLIKITEIIKLMMSVLRL
jgi:folate-dependent phosphoribosylglycinamide formyltransferase PurN